MAAAHRAQRLARPADAQQRDRSAAGRDRDPSHRRPGSRAERGGERPAPAGSRQRWRHCRSTCARSSFCARSRIFPTITSRSCSRCRLALSCRALRGRGRNWQPTCAVAWKERLWIARLVTRWSTPRSTASCRRPTAPPLSSRWRPAPTAGGGWRAARTMSGRLLRELPAEAGA